MPLDRESPPDWPAREAVFDTTHWSVVLAAGQRDAPESAPALEQLCRAYWPPLYAFLRRQGCPRDEAEDLVQGFFERFIAKDYLRSVSPEKGRFRSFLLASLRHYAANVHRDARTERRGGATMHLDIAAPGVAARCEAALQIDSRPEVIFDRVWAEMVMDAAAGRLRREYHDAGRGELFAAIRLWLVCEPRDGEYSAAARKLGLSDGAVAVAVHRLRQRFRQLVRSAVARTVESPAEVDEEMRHLLRVLTARNLERLFVL